VNKACDNCYWRDYKDNQNIKEKIKQLIDRYSKQYDNYEKELNDENYSFYKGMQYFLVKIRLDSRELLKEI